MKIQKAKETVCAAGLKLVEEGLVSRTWGNISCRVDEKSFVITPSGRTYDDLTPDDIVLVNIEDLSWTGRVKPSSEKGLHAEVYKLDLQTEAVIHTHQSNASAVASARREIPLISSEMESIIGQVIPCASYGLPGTGKLKSATADALRISGGKAALMANHGAICRGNSMDDAFLVAITLEKVCALFVKQEYMKLSGEIEFSLESMHDFYIQRFSKGGRI